MKNTYQEKFGYPAERTAGKVRQTIAPWIQEFIRARRFACSRQATRKETVTLHPKGAKPDL